MKGWATLKTPQDLARKVQRDLKRLERSPADVDVALDFFLTAFHVLDWIYPDSKADQDRLRGENPFLNIAGHLCNGAKHFEAKDRRWGQVTDIGPRGGGYWASGYWASGYWSRTFWARERLIVKLRSTEAEQFGVSELDVLSVAEKVCRFWETYFGLSPVP